MSSFNTIGDGSWPKYAVGTPEYAHAVGILSINYNSLESEFQQFHLFCADAPEPVVALLFEQLNNDRRIDLLKKMIAINISDPKFADHVTHFIAGFRVCTDNRNTIIHASVGALSTNQGTVAFKRARKSGQEAIYHFQLDTIRRVADEIHEWARFGHLTLHHALYLQRVEQKDQFPDGWTIVGPPTLPEKPAVPEILKSNPLPFKIFV